MSITSPVFVYTHWDVLPCRPWHWLPRAPHSFPTPHLCPTGHPRQTDSQCGNSPLHTGSRLTCLSICKMSWPPRPCCVSLFAIITHEAFPGTKRSNGTTQSSSRIPLIWWFTVFTHHMFGQQFNRPSYHPNRDGEPSDTLSPIPLSTWCLNVLTFSCIRRIAHSALPLQTNSATGLVVDIIWSGHNDGNAACNATINCSWPELTWHVTLCMPLLSKSNVIVLTNHAISPVTPLSGALWTHIPHAGAPLRLNVVDCSP